MRDLSGVLYCPILALRPSEMLALEELPSHVKDEIFPLIFIQPWTTAHYLNKAVDRVIKAYGNRPIIADLNQRALYVGERPVFKEINDLKKPNNGYDNWYNFILNHPNMVPTIQLRNLDELSTQVEKLSSLNRGLVLRFTEENMSASPEITRIVKPLINENDLIIIFDFEKTSNDILNKQALVIGLINACNLNVQEAYYVISASSFPDSFISLNEQEIFERLFFNQVSNQLPENKLIYSDRGSARPQSNMGGGGTPAPRIDYPFDQSWRFYREEFDSTGDPKIDKALKKIAYREAAKKLIKDGALDDQIRIWGTQMIEKTKEDKPKSIDSPAKATAVRINIHLHRQNSYGKPRDELLDTDEDFED